MYLRRSTVVFLTNYAFDSKVCHSHHRLITFLNSFTGLDDSKSPSLVDGHAPFEISALSVCNFLFVT